jgi:hypothetical protein
MNTEQKISTGFELVQFIWDNEKPDSLSRVNSIMQNALKLAINAQLEFDKNDFENIYKMFNGGYWFGANTNGKGDGENFYSLACEVKNISAAKSYESFYDFKPFITQKGNRLHDRSQLRNGDRRFIVTGFDFNTKKIHFVSYAFADWEHKGKKQLHSFDNKEWNAARKGFEE